MNPIKTADMQIFGRSIQANCVARGGTTGLKAHLGGLYVTQTLQDFSEFAGK